MATCPTYNMPADGGADGQAQDQSQAPQMVGMNSSNAGAYSHFGTPAYTSHQYQSAAASSGVRATSHEPQQRSAYEHDAQDIQSPYFARPGHGVYQDQYLEQDQHEETHGGQQDYTPQDPAPEAPADTSSGFDDLLNDADAFREVLLGPSSDMAYAGEQQLADTPLPAPSSPYAGEQQQHLTNTPLAMPSPALTAGQELSATARSNRPAQQPQQNRASAEATALTFQQRWPDQPLFWASYAAQIGHGKEAQVMLQEDANEVSGWLWYWLPRQHDFNKWDPTDVRILMDTLRERNVIVDWRSLDSYFPDVQQSIPSSAGDNNSIAAEPSALQTPMVDGHGVERPQGLNPESEEVSHSSAHGHHYPVQNLRIKQYIPAQQQQQLVGAMLGDYAEVFEADAIPSQQVGDSEDVPSDSPQLEQVRRETIFTKALRDELHGLVERYSTEAARADFLRTHDTTWTPKANDTTIPTTPDAIQAHVEELSQAMCKTEYAVDSVENNAFKGRWIPGPAGKMFYSKEKIVNRCWQVVLLAIKLHTDGPSALQCFDEQYAKLFKATEKWSFKERMDTMARLLLTRKSRCDFVMKAENLDAFVGAPHKLEKNSAQNGVNNVKKSKALKRGMEELEKAKKVADAAAATAEADNAGATGTGVQTSDTASTLKAKKSKKATGNGAVTRQQSPQVQTNPPVTAATTSSQQPPSRLSGFQGRQQSRGRTLLPVPVTALGSQPPPAPTAAPTPSPNFDLGQQGDMSGYRRFKQPPSNLKRRADDDPTTTDMPPREELTNKRKRLVGVDYTDYAGARMPPQKRGRVEEVVQMLSPAETPRSETLSLGAASPYTQGSPYEPEDRHQVGSAVINQGAINPAVAYPTVANPAVINPAPTFAPPTPFASTTAGSAIPSPSNPPLPSPAPSFSTTSILGKRRTGPKGDKCAPLKRTRLE